MISRRLSSIFKHSTTYNQAILDLLEDTTIGTDGAKYRHLHTAQKIADLHEPNYFTIYRYDKAIGNITICNRPMMVGETLTNTFYIRYFAFHSVFQTTKKAKVSDKANGAFQKYIEALLSTSNLDVETPEYDPKMYWAIVDPENKRSLQMVERYNFEVVSRIKTIAFSRFKLKQGPEVSRALPEEQDEIWNELQKFYKDFNGLTKVHLFNKNNYFVLKENNEIVAGIKADKVNWRIERLPGLSGKLLVKTLPYLPFLKRIINPKKYQFLATEGLFWKEGYEHLLENLLEGVLFEQQYHSMLIWTDSRADKLNKALFSMNLGLLQKVKTDNDVNLVVKFNNVSEKTRTVMKNSPHYFLGFDCT